MAIGVGICTFAQNALFGMASEILTERIRERVFASILRQDVGFFDDEANATGVLTSNLSSDAQKVQAASGTTLGVILQFLATIVGCIVISMSGLKFYAKKSKKAYEQSAQVACEAVAAVRTVQSLTRESQLHMQYLDILKQPMRDGVKNAFLNTLLYAFAQSINFLVMALVFWYGGRLMAYEGYTAKQFFVTFISVVLGSQNAGRIFSFAPDVTKARAAGEAILRLLERMPPIDPDPFSYPTRRHIRVLKGLNISVKSGQFAALVGPSGCGKSTTVGLIERFYNVDGGQILLDGTDISRLNVESHREAIGLVSQEPNLFDMSIRDNVAFGCKVPPTQAEIKAACKEDNIDDFIMTLPDEYDTKVGARGGQLSGGQKQRIAIARALVRKPKILLLDEATSALNAESELVVQEALDKAAKGRTTIAVAHRLSTIQKADVIFVLKDGAVVEQGTHDELFARRGLYHELVVQQNLCGEPPHHTHIP
ncbi:hypothetical protein HK105_204752 [Polyrhizophydium stewartii]|uniref:Uncharacterized protein n=1 Tax=Polyrhizophydium stewartii TaxID=2732419 RepID=A0ABR4N8F0_9FUNG